MTPAPKRRKSDRRRLAAAWDKYGRDLTTVAAVALAAYAIVVTQHTVGDLKREGEDRRDQSCLIFEGKQKTDVDALRRTYEYLAGLSTRQMAEPLNRAVLAQLPTTIRNAQADDAPAYCDAEGIGLPEPDPTLPAPPPNLPTP